MRVYYDAAGRVLYSLDVGPTFRGAMPDGLFIEVETFEHDPSSVEVIAGQLVQVAVADAAFLAACRQRINDLAGAARSHFVTDGAGQQMIYLAKQEEARALLSLAAEPSDTSAFPFLSAEVGVTGSSATEVAQVVLNLAHQWAAIGSAIERLRVSANAGVSGAVLRSAASASCSEFQAALNDLLTGWGRAAV